MCTLVISIPSYSVYMAVYVSTWYLIHQCSILNGKISACIYKSEYIRAGSDSLEVYKMYHFKIK